MTAFLFGTFLVLVCGSMLVFGFATGKMIAPGGTAYRDKRPVRFWRLTATYTLGASIGLLIAARTWGV